MTKLTMYMRENIANRTCDHKYKARFDALKEDESNLALLAVIDNYGLKTINAGLAFPNQSLIVMGKQVCVNAGGWSVDLTSETPVVGGGNGWSKRLPIKEEALATRIRTHRRTVDDLKKERNEAYYKLLAMLKSFSTLKMLQKQWPEGEPFYSNYFDVGTVQLPAVQFEAINKEFGLPVEAAVV